MTRERRGRGRGAALALWSVVAIVVWNALYDERISLGVREYLYRALLHEAGHGPPVVLADAMAATVGDAVRVASLWAAVLWLAGLATIALLRGAGSGGSAER